MASTNGNGVFSAHMPILDGKNYNKWCIQMKTIFEMQDALDVVQSGIQDLEKSASDAPEKTFKELKKRDCKALFLIHQGVDAVNFEKIASAATTKQAWEILAKAYAGSDKLKKIRLQNLRRQYEMLQMNDKETVGEYLGHVQIMTNQMSVCGESLKE